MFQNGIIGIRGFHRGLPYLGGFCQWWFIPAAHVATFYPVSLITQKMETEPLLKAGKNWMGPIRVPDKKLGWEESQERSKAGIFYRHKVSGFHAGDNGASRINLQNMAYPTYCIVGKLRAGGQYILIGNKYSGLSFDHTFKSGDNGSDGTAGSSFTFTGECSIKAVVLPTFLGGESDADFTYQPPVTLNPRPMEVINFTNVSQVIVSWNAGRIANFGHFPLIEVWIDDGINPIYLDGTASISVDAAPPSQTAFTINLSGPVSGFIILK